MNALSARAEPLANQDGTILMVPMDHGISMGPVAGLDHPGDLLAAVAEAGATCAVGHKGLARHLVPHHHEVGCLMHLSASTDVGPDPHHKVLVGTVGEALDLGFAGASIHINLGSATEPQQLRDAGFVGTACNAADVPFLAMVYPRGPNIKDPFQPELVAHAARLGAELGADVVKVPYTGSADTFDRVVQGALGVPVIVAGGPPVADFDALLRNLRDARVAGAAGVSIGRNVFQAPDPQGVMRRIAEVFA